MRIGAMRTGAMIVAGGAALLLAGCATDDGRDRPRPPHHHQPTACKADRVQSMAGKTADQRTIRMAQRMARARTVRVLRPGQPATMDYRPDRLNLEVDGRDRIVSARCG